MNILAHLAALIAMGWVADFVFSTMNQPLLGFAVVTAMVLYLPLAWVAVNDDKDILG